MDAENNLFAIYHIVNLKQQGGESIIPFLEF